MKWLQKVFYGAPFGRKYKITKHVTLWSLERKPGAVIKVQAGGGHYFAKLSEPELTQLIETANTILTTKGTT